MEIQVRQALLPDEAFPFGLLVGFTDDDSVQVLAVAPREIAEVVAVAIAIAGGPVQMDVPERAILLAMEDPNR